MSPVKGSILKQNNFVKSYRLFIKQLFGLKYIHFSLVGLILLVMVLLVLMPAEENLGGLIKLIFLHGALVQAGLLSFAAAGIFGFYYIVRKKNTIHSWCLAAQKTSVILWILYCLSSIVVTYLAWGVAIAWDEPRVQVSAKILVFCVVFLIITLWVHYKIFTAAVNVIMAVLAWFLVKSAVVVQHPFNPIGTSESPVFKIYFIALFVVILLMAIQIVRLFHTRKEYD